MEDDDDIDGQFQGSATDGCDLLDCMDIDSFPFEDKDRNADADTKLEIMFNLMRKAKDNPNMHFAGDIPQKGIACLPMIHMCQ